MLIHRFLSGNRSLASAQEFAKMITLCAFPFMPEPGECFVSILKDVKRNLVSREVRTLRFFCFQNQFTIEFQEFPDRYEFKPHWHCHKKDAIEKEKAIAILHDHCFEQQGDAEGF